MDPRNRLDDWPAGAVLGSTSLDDVGIMDGTLLWPTGDGVHVLVDCRGDVCKDTGFLL